MIHETQMYFRIGELVEDSIIEPEYQPTPITFELKDVMLWYKPVDKDGTFVQFYTDSSPWHITDDYYFFSNVMKYFREPKKRKTNGKPSTSERTIKKPGKE